MLARKQITQLFVVFFLLLYAVASYYVASTEQEALLSLFLPLVPSGLLFLVVTKSLSMLLKGFLLLLIGFVVWFIGVNQQCFSCLYLLQYTAIMLVFLMWFGLSLLPNKRALCTQFSDHIHKVASERLAHYTRSVTIAWTVFFLLMLITSVILYFVISIAAWSFFTYFMTAPLIGLMFLGEYFIRKHRLPAEEALDFMSAIRAYRLYAQENLHG